MAISWIVLVQAACPGCIQRWGQEPEGGLETIPWWRKSSVVAVQHPRWGAQMAAAAGTSPLAVTLIRRHQETLVSPVEQETALRQEILLQILQSVDDRS